MKRGCGLEGMAIYIFYALFIIIRNIEMGCGAVCGVEAPTSNQQALYSLNKIRQLSTQLKISPPLLTEAAFRQFSSILQHPQNPYILRVGERVGSQDEIEIEIMQKWKFLLYGLDKDDQIYKRNRIQQVTNSQNLINNLPLTNNKSYHQLKPNTQYHECFTQIEKDLNRTFEFKQQKKKIFQNILKRISNYFPSMGYTQGVNFVVGYLLIAGYSQSDAFWMFVHLAINRRYLLLGLYEDGFPLAYIYTTIFKKMLQRMDKQLYNHLYCNLMLDQSIWIFKWFITYYIYSFPFSTIKYIWNLVIELGGIALVYYAIAFVMHIRSHLLKIEDPCDISEFFQGFKDLHRFNELIKINQIIQKVYQMKLTKQDLAEVSTLHPSFYQNYYSKILTDSVNKEELHSWYQKLIKQRKQFKENEIQKQSQLSHLPQKLKSQYLDLQKSITILQEKIIRNQSIKLNRVASQQEKNYFQDLIIDEPIQIQLKDKAEPQYELESKARIATKMSYDMEESINEVENQSDSNSSQIEQASYRLPYEESNMKKKKEAREETAYPLKINTIIGQIDIRKSGKESSIKASIIKIDNNNHKRGLALAGENILCNLSVTNSHYSSSQSKNPSFKPKKHKENNMARHHKIAKVKTQEMSQPSIEPSSSRQSSLDYKTDKQSFSGMTYRQNVNNQTVLHEINEDRKSQQDFMVNSQGPKKNMDEPSKQLTSQVQLFNGVGLFKKKKNYNRNSSLFL